MKKLLFSAAILLCSVAARAQTSTPTTATQILDRPVAIDQPRAEPRLKTHGPGRRAKATAPASHGQAVRAAAHSALPGPGKGAAVSAVARGSRGPHRLRTARSERSQGSRATRTNHQSLHQGRNQRYAGQ